MASAKSIPTIVANEGARVSLRALADKFATTLPMHRGVIEAAIERVVEALRSGRVDLYLRAHYDLKVAADELVRELGTDVAVMDSLEVVDPAASIAARSAAFDLGVADARRSASRLPTRELVDYFARHKIDCRHGDRCVAHAALEAELAARGIRLG